LIITKHGDGSLWFEVVETGNFRSVLNLSNLLGTRGRPASAILGTLVHRGIAETCARASISHALERDYLRMGEGMRLFINPKLPLA
jgi:hypothetical protein